MDRAVRLELDQDPFLSVTQPPAMRFLSTFSPGHQFVQIKTMELIQVLKYALWNRSSPVIQQAAYGKVKERTGKRAETKLCLSLSPRSHVSSTTISSTYFIVFFKAMLSN